MSKYLGLFVSEATEHLEGLGSDLVTLERGGGAEAVDSMFRHAHSVKGMAASMGFEPIAVMAHRVEDVVAALRQDPTLQSRERVDLLLSAADVMLAQVKCASEGTSLPAGEAVLQQLSELVQKLTGAAPEHTRVADAGVPAPSNGPPAEAPLPAALPPTPEVITVARPVSGERGAQKSELGLPPRFNVRVQILPSCRVPGVRGFLVYKKLSSLGNVFNLRPALEELKAGRIPEGKISLELETSEPEAAVRQALGNVSEVELSSLALLAAQASAAPHAPPTAQPASEGGPSATAVTARTVRVRTELLDHFLDTVGEMLLATARLKEMGRTLPEPHRAPMEEGVYRLHALVKDLHGKVMTARMTPLSVITDRLPRAARDIARKRGRDVDLVITGAEIELDRVILEDLADPLLHMLRNSIDHGIESPEDRVAAGKSAQGRVLVSIKRVRDRVVVEIEDDGRGMNAKRLKEVAVERGLFTAEAAERMTDREAFLISCLPGVTTAKNVSEISGRGVGMDSVKRTVENVGGTLEIESELGKGTRFTLRLPLTVAVVHLLLVGVATEVYGLPIAKVVGAMEAPSSALSRSRETLMLPHGNQLVPVHWLGDLLELNHAPARDTHPYVILEVDGGPVALAVDTLLGQEEVVLKALSQPLDLVSGLAGVTILGNGRPIFILDVPRLLSP